MFGLNVLCILCFINYTIIYIILNYLTFIIVNQKLNDNLKKSSIVYLLETGEQ